MLGVLPGIIGIIQATEAIKLILGAGQPLVGRLAPVRRAADALPGAEAAARSRVPGLRRPSDDPRAHRLRRVLRRDAGDEPRTVSSGVPEVTVEELKAQIDRGEDVFMLDVREPNEYQICRIQGSKLIPLGEVAARVRGTRSATASIDRPLQDGRPQREGGRACCRSAASRTCCNLKGGILAWIDTVDPSQPKY